MHLCLLFDSKCLLVVILCSPTLCCFCTTTELQYRYSPNLYLPISKVCISFQTCLKSCHISEFSQQTFRLTSILTVQTCFGPGNLAWDLLSSSSQPFFLATFQSKAGTVGRHRSTVGRHRSTIPKGHHRIATVSFSHWFQNCSIFHFLSLRNVCIQHSQWPLQPALFPFTHVSIFRSFWMSDHQAKGNVHSRKLWSVVANSACCWISSAPVF